MKILYFAHIDGAERLLNVEFDPKSLSVNFKYDEDKDPSHEEESGDVVPVSVSDSVKCTDKDQFDGFARALAKAMKSTSFSLQDPDQGLFANMDQDKLKLDEFGAGVPLEQLTCQIPSKVVPYIVRTKYAVKQFQNLIDDKVLDL